MVSSLHIALSLASQRKRESTKRVRQRLSLLPESLPAARETEIAYEFLRVRPFLFLALLDELLFLMSVVCGALLVIVLLVTFVVSPFHSLSRSV